ncbi:hypothetical protein [Nonlabens xylanidelens]|uniref:hypothetical protein n=1 Tax=Nonlabens xylanidelens TaxID=191564 RepID=UPI000CF57B27
MQDAGEPGIPGVDVVVTDEGGTPQTVMTDANGDWITVVPVGITLVDVQDPVGSALTTAGSDPENVTVIAGSEELLSTTDLHYH